MSRQAILITGDKDFGGLVFRQRLAPHGVVLLRLPGMPPAARATRVVAAVSPVRVRLAGSFTAIDPSGIRIRST